jgi:hypothetical protein
MVGTRNKGPIAHNDIEVDFEEEDGEQVDMDSEEED